MNSATWISSIEITIGVRAMFCVSIILHGIRQLRINQEKYHSSHKEKLCTFIHLILKRSTRRQVCVFWGLLKSIRVAECASIPISLKVCNHIGHRGEDVNANIWHSGHIFKTYFN